MKLPEKARRVLDQALALARPVSSAQAVARMIEAGRQRRREALPLEPWETGPDDLTRARDFLNAYDIAVRKLDNGWFEPDPDPVFEHALVAWIDEAEQRGRLALARELAASGGAFSECTCRCRDHQLVGCATCLRVEQCELHTDDDPARVSPLARGEEL